MADILFTHAFFLRLDPKQWRSMQPYAPLATMFAASYLRQQGFEVAVFDSMLAEDPNALVPALEKHRPRVVVFHEDNFNWLSKMCLSRMRAACFAMMRLVRRLGGEEVAIIVAGSDATDHREMYLHQGADFVVLGESEVALHELIATLLDRNATPVERIAGLAYLDNGVIQRGAPRGFLKNLDILPLPAWDLIDTERYRRRWRRKHGYYSVNMVTTRGCPFHCNWCAKPIYGDRYNSRSPENVVAEMLWLRRHVQPEHIWFADDIFGLKPGWVAQFAEQVQKAEVVTPFKIQARVDLLDDAVVAALQAAGCKTVWVGAESGSQKILEAMEKGITVEQIHRTTLRLRRHGIEVGFFLQFGYPGETEDDIEQTLKMVRDCQPDDIGISVSYPLPGTRFYDRVKSELAAKQNWQDSADLDLMFAGTYQPDFYRQLHRVVHQEFRLHKTLQRLRQVMHQPSALTLADLRRFVGTAVRLPWLPAAQSRLQRLKTANGNLPSLRSEASCDPIYSGGRTTIPFNRR